MAMFNAVDTRVSQIYKFQLCKYTANEYTQTKSPQRPWETLKIRDLEVKWRAMQKVRKEYQLKVKYCILCAHTLKLSQQYCELLSSQERENACGPEWLSDVLRATELVKWQNWNAIWFQITSSPHYYSKWREMKAMFSTDTKQH